MKWLLDNKYYPIVNEFGFSHCTYDEAYAEWETVIQLWRADNNNNKLKVENSTIQVSGSLKEILDTYLCYHDKHYNPGIADVTLILESKSNWVLGFVPRIEMVSFKHEFNTFIGREAPGDHGLTRFIYRSQATRSGKQVERWVQVGHGENGLEWDCTPDDESPPLPFEEIEAYKNKKLKDRLTPEMLQRYANALGIRPYDEDFYGNRAFIVFNSVNTPLTKEQAYEKLETAKRKALYILKHPDIPTPTKIDQVVVDELNAIRKERYLMEESNILFRTNERDGDIMFDRKDARYVGSGRVSMELVLAAIRSIKQGKGSYLDVGTSGIKYGEWLLARGENAKRKLDFIELNHQWNASALLTRFLIEATLACYDILDGNVSGDSSMEDPSGFALELEERIWKDTDPEIKEEFMHFGFEASVPMALYERQQKTGAEEPGLNPVFPMDSVQKISIEGLRNNEYYQFETCGTIIEAVSRFVAIRFHKPNSIIEIIKGD